MPGKVIKPRRWTPEVIVAELQAASASGVRMNSASIMRRSGALHRAARRAFGSLQAAVEAAGLKYQRQEPRWYPRKPKAVLFEPVVEFSEMRQHEILPVAEEFKVKYQAGKRPKCGYF